MWTKLWKECAYRLPNAASLDVTTEAELTALPPAARTYMDFHGVLAGAPKRWSFCLGWTGRFRMAPDRPWMRIEAVHYDTRLPVARIFHMKWRLNGIVPVLARDTYVDGRGHMLAKLAGLVTVADGRGPEFDAGELVTWLNDAVLFAPSMLLGPSTRYSHVDARTFDVAFTDCARTVTARVSIDDRGAPVDFETTDRYLNDPGDPRHPLVSRRWSTPIEAWRRIGHQPMPTRGKATWHLPDGDFTYAEFEPVLGTLAFDVPPSGPIPRARAA
jgi:hypothetical protein